MTARHIALYLQNGAGGGIQRVTTLLAREFSARGHRVDLVFSDASGPFAEGPSPAQKIALPRTNDLAARLAVLRADPAGWRASLLPLVLPARIPMAMRTLPGLAAYLREARPQILLAAGVHPNLAAILARMASGSDCRVLLSERGDYKEKLTRSWRWRWRFVAPALRRYYAMADAVLSVSEDLAERLPEYTGLRPGSIIPMHNPVVGPEVRDGAREAPDHPWLAQKDVPVVLGVGRLEVRKGFDTLIAAFAELRRERPMRLVILGEGHLRGRLEKQAAEAGVADSVDLAGWKPNVFAYMARSDLFVLSSHNEGLPGSLIQALACGCPVVATDCPTGPREILKGGAIAPLVPMQDPAAMAAAMREQLDRPSDAAARLARAADFSVEAAIDRYEALFERVLSSTAR